MKEHDEQSRMKGPHQGPKQTYMAAREIWGSFSAKITKPEATCTLEGGGRCTAHDFRLSKYEYTSAIKRIDAMMQNVSEADSKAS